MWSTSSSTTLPFTRTSCTLLGRRVRRMARRRLFSIRERRITFRPPPVDPAQAPTAIRQSRMALEKAGQTSKSTVEKPVVVMMLLTWK